MQIKSFKDIKAMCVLKGYKLSEIHHKLGYTSLWGLKLGLKSKKKKEILEKATHFFLND